MLNPRSAAPSGGDSPERLPNRPAGFNFKRRTAARLLAVVLSLAALGFLYAPKLLVSSQGVPNLPPQTPFPDFGYLPPPEQYRGPVFKLSQDYPRTRPAAATRPRFLEIDFKQDWRGYVNAVRNYCFEGNTEVDWRVENNKVRRWFHMPWQHWGLNGREGVHGLTKEAPVSSKQLAVTQTRTGQTYAVGFYNDFGGYTIGQVWRDHMNPNPSVTSVRGGGFPVGTVVCKVLAVTLDDPPGGFPNEQAALADLKQQVPFLANPIRWDGYITATYGGWGRSMRKLSVIQMDIMVKDPRAPTGWLFGTFQYNGALGNADKWDNLIPVGLQWGNDPDITDSTYTNLEPAVTRINPNLKESVINSDTSELPPTHLGWNGRLNGPVDNPQSSCMSCHMTAESPATSPMMPLFQANPPKVGSREWMRWFQNMSCGTPFDRGSKSTDDSLQLAISIQNFLTWRNEDGIYASDYAPTRSAPASRGGRGAARRSTKVKEFLILRDARPEDTEHPTPP